MGKIKGYIIFLFIYLIKAYQLVSKTYFKPCCRFHPSCSDYCIEALKKRGILLGFLLTFKRIFRCRPGGSSGYDPVP